MYLKYGGKDLAALNPNDLRKNLSTLRIFQFAIMLISCITAFVIEDPIVLAFSCAILPLNMIAYFRLLFQAIGEFDKYGRITNISTGITFLINAILTVVLRNDNYIIFLVCYVVWDISYGFY